MINSLTFLYVLSVLICLLAHLHDCVRIYKNGNYIRLSDILTCCIYPFLPVFNTIAAFILLISIIYDNPVIIKGKKNDS